MVITEWLILKSVQNAFHFLRITGKVRKWGSHTETCDQDCDLFLDAIRVRIPGAHRR